MISTVKYVPCWSRPPNGSGDLKLLLRGVRRFQNVRHMEVGFIRDFFTILFSAFADAHPLLTDLHKLIGTRTGKIV